MANLDAGDITSETADATFETAAAWDADSVTHAADPTAEPVIAAEPALADDPAPELTADEPNPEDRDDSGRFKKRKARTDPQARVEKATAREAAAKEEARLAREDAAQWKAKAEARTTSTPPTTPAQPQTVAAPAFTFPKRDAWLTEHPNAEWDDYDDAKLEARDQWRESRQQETARWQTHGQRLGAAVQSDATLPALIQSGTQAIAAELAKVGLTDLPKTIEAAILESDRGVDYYRYLLTHPAEAAQLAVEAKDAPVSAARLVRRYLDSVTTGAVPVPDSASRVRTSSATAPISRVGGTASATPANPDDLEFGPEYIRLENKKDRERAAAGRW